MPGPARGVCRDRPFRGGAARAARQGPPALHQRAPHLRREGACPGGRGRRAGRGTPGGVCGVRERPGAGRLELLGKDRQRFINAYLTCDVKGLAPGGGAYGFVTSSQGRILSDVVVLAHEDRLWLELGPDQEEPI